MLDTFVLTTGHVYFAVDKNGNQITVPNIYYAKLFKTFDDANFAINSMKRTLKRLAWNIKSIAEDEIKIITDIIKYPIINKARNLRNQNCYKSAAKFIKENAEHICCYCHKPIFDNELSIDHAIPLCRGGTNDFMNLRLCHKKCNERKSHRTEKEYVQLVLHKPYSMIEENINIMTELKKKRDNNKVVTIQPNPQKKRYKCNNVLNINDIKVPKLFLNTPPKEKKINGVRKYYMSYHELDKPITIKRSKKNILIDGYTRYIVAKEFGLNKVPVIYEN